MSVTIRTALTLILGMPMLGCTASSEPPQAVTPEVRQESNHHNPTAEPRNETAN